MDYIAQASKRISLPKKHNFIIFIKGLKWQLPRIGHSPHLEFAFLHRNLYKPSLAGHPLSEGLFPIAMGYYPAAFGHRMHRQQENSYLLIYCIDGKGHPDVRRQTLPNPQRRHYFIATQSPPRLQG